MNNRKLKFRFWDIPSKRYINCCSVTEHGFIKDIGTHDYYGDVVPQQYTGQKDKTGKEIYEGDIVLDRADCNCLNKEMDVFTVEYDEVYSAFVLTRRGGGSWNWIRNVSTYGEVIGNIFEPLKYM